MRERDLKSSRLRRSFVASPYGGLMYPAYLRIDAKSDGRGHVRPFFTRRTVTRVLADTARLDQEWLASDDDDSFEPSRFHWEGPDLVVDYSPYHPGWDYPRRFVRNRLGLYAFLDRGDWVEFLPPWPRREPSAQGVLRLLAAPSVNCLPLLDRIKQRVSSVTLRMALEIAGHDAQEQLILILSPRPEPEAAEAISLYLAATDPFVRAEAAHAFEHRGVGPYVSELLQAARVEQRDDVLQLQVRALGTADPVDAPVVIAWLDGLRGRAAANPALGRALRVALEGLGIPAADLPDHLGGAIIGPDRRSRRNVG